MTARQPADPFGTLGLRADAEVTDDEVRAAWRRVAAATHPDRADGGDPEQFALPAAAYTQLRTAFGRGEARAELHAWPTGPAATSLGRPAPAVVTKVTTGRLARLLLKLAVAASAGTAGVLAAGPGSAAAPALGVGALTWFLLSARHEFRPR